MDAASAAAIRPAVKEESEEKLARFDKVVSGQPVSPSPFGFGDRPGGGRPPRAEAGGPEAGGPDMPRFGPPPFEMMSPAKPIKGFVVARTKSVSDQLAGKVNEYLKNSASEKGSGGESNGKGSESSGKGFTDESSPKRSSPDSDAKKRVELL